MLGSPNESTKSRALRGSGPLRTVVLVLTIPKVAVPSLRSNSELKDPVSLLFDEVGILAVLITAADAEEPGTVGDIVRTMLRRGTQETHM